MLEFDYLNFFSNLNSSAFWDVKLEVIAQLKRDLPYASLTLWQKLLYFSRQDLQGKPCRAVTTFEFDCLNLFPNLNSSAFWDVKLDRIAQLIIDLPNAIFTPW